MILGAEPPRLRGELPGPRTLSWVERLAASECPAFTARRARRAEASGASHDPIVWEKARGANVVDTDGNVFVDLTAGFGVAAAGHGHPAIVEAIRSQSEDLVHALGDVHPSPVKIALLERLGELSPFANARTVLGLNGSDAIAAALKTAVLFTGRSGVVAFEGGYHGLMYAPLALSGLDPAFSSPFRAQLNAHVRAIPFPADEAAIEASLEALTAALASGDIGAVVVEPILGRGGVLPAPPGFLAALAHRAHDAGALLVLDEIFTGLGRTGRRFAHEWDGARPDLLCLGKALGGGLPLSACIGPEEIMRAWGDPKGAAIHTATFAGHPLGCAAALAALELIEGEALASRAEALGTRMMARLAERLEGRVRGVRGRGLMIGVELGADAGRSAGARTLALVRRLLERGYLTLPAGRGAEVLSITPPLNIDEGLLEGFERALDESLEALR